MQLLFSTIFSNWTNFIATSLIVWLIYKLSKFYFQVWNLPRGPFPWPLIGNILTLRGRKCNNAITLTELAKNYGPMFTFWVGNKPVIMISDLEMAKEAMKKPECSDRIKFSMFEMLKGVKNERSDIAFDNFGHRWKNNRNVTLAAVKKYSMSVRLAELVSDVIDEIVNDMKTNEKRPFDLETYVKSIYFIILASSAFGRRYTMDDPELVRIRYLLEAIEDPKVAMAEFLPIFKLVYKGFYQNFLDNFTEYVDIVKAKFNQHLVDFDENQIRDFCDELLLAKREAIAEAKESAEDLTDDNLSLAIFDLFFAGSDTSQMATRWLILLMANYPEYQRKMRDEIASVIGDRMPVQSDRNECHLINAFFHESLRFRPVAPLSVPHVTTRDIIIDGQTIPAPMTLVQSIWSIHHNPKHFAQPDKFKPERFLDLSGRFVSQKPAAFIPFGSGRRVCLGERLAIADIFLVVVNLLQKTNGYEISLKSGPGSGDLEMNPDRDLVCQPKNFEIVLKKI